METSRLSKHATEHFETIRAHHEKCDPLTNAARGYREILANYYSFLIPASASVLEVGCGAGHFLAQLRSTRKAGVDLSAAQIGLAKEGVPGARFFVQAAEELDLPGETFDYVILSETINLAADAQRILERLPTVSHPPTRLI